VVFDVRLIGRSYITILSIISGTNSIDEKAIFTVSFLSKHYQFGMGYPQ
jgi:hypothetical protein